MTQTPARATAAVPARDRPTWVSYLQLGTYGWFLYAFGPSLALLRDEQGTSRAVSGLHGTALAVGGVLGGLVSPMLVRRIGRGAVLRLGSALLAIGLVWYTSRPGLPVTLSGILVASLGGTFVLVGLNAFLTDHHGPAAPRALSEGNAIAACAGLLAPLAVGAGVAIGWGWRPALLVVVAGLVVVEALRGRHVDAYDGRHGHPTSEPGHDPAGPLPARYWSAWVVLLMLVGVEFSFTLWGADLLRADAGLGAAAAAASLASIVGGMAVGRIAGAPLVSRYDPERVLAVAIAVTATGFVVAWVGDASVPMLLGFFLAGLGVSLHWPLGVSRALRASGGHTDRASGLASVGAATASGAAPFALGALADAVGIHSAFLVVPGLLTVALVVLLARPVPLALAEPAEAPA